MPRDRIALARTLQQQLQSYTHTSPHTNAHNRGDAIVAIGNCKWATAKATATTTTKAVQAYETVIQDAKRYQAMAQRAVETHNESIRQLEEIQV